MATVTVAIAGAGDTGNTPNPTASFTPAQGDLLVVLSTVSGTTTGNGTVTASANGITFTRATTSRFGADDVVEIHVADQLVPASPVAMTATWENTTDQGSGSVIGVARVAGMARTGSSAIRQTAIDQNRTSGTASCVFGVACLTGNPTLGMVGSDGVNSTTSAVPPSGWTEGGDVGYSNPTMSGEWCYRNSGFTGTTVTWTSHTATTVGAAFLELDASAIQNVNPTEASATTTAANTTSAVSTATTYDKTVIGDTPVSFWNDDSGTDVIGLSNLTKFNSPTSTQAPDGTNCMVFNGTNQYAEGTDQNAYSIPTTGRLTFEAWIRPDVLEFPDTESTGYVNWAGKTGAGATNDAEWLTRMYSKTTTDVPPRPHRVSGYAFNPDGGLGTGGYFEDPLALGEWIHVVFVVNKADAGGSYPDGYGILYKNGVLRRQENLDVGGTAINPGNGTAPFRIGSARAQSSFFKGAIAKPAIYSYELSAAQVLKHYNAMRMSLALSQDAAASVGASASVASVTGAANNATITTGGGGSPDAEAALVSGSVEVSSRLVSASARTA